MKQANSRAAVLGAVWLVIASGFPPGSAAALDEPTGVMRLSDALALALMDNPELAPFAWQERVNESRFLQAGLRHNPEFSIEAEDVLGTGSFSGGRQAQTTLQLSQVIELGGKRAARAGAASQARSITRSDYESKRVEVLADATQRFIQVVAKQHALNLALANRQLADDALQIVQERVKAGKGSALEERKAQVASARGELLVEAAGHELSAARKILSASWGSANPVFERAEADLFARGTVPPFEELARLISRSPQVARWASEKQLREAEIKLARSQRVPALTLSGGVRRFEGSADEAFLFGLSLPLQLFDRNQGGLAEAQAMLGWAEAEQKAAEARLGSILLSLYGNVVHDMRVMEGLETEILPKAEDALQMARDGYVEGRFSYLEVLDAQRTIFEVNTEYIATSASYHQFLVEIERLVGRPFVGAESR